MKILHVIPAYIPAYRYGGSVKMAHELCKSLKRRGLEISVFTTNADGEKKLNVPLYSQQDIEGVKVTYFPLAGFMHSYYYSSTLSAALKERVSHFDIVHIHSVYLFPTNIAAYWSRKRGIPYIINPFGALDSCMIRLKNSIIKKIYIEMIERKNIEKATIIQVASLYEKKQFLALGFKAPAMILPCGLNFEEYISKEPMNALKKRYPQLKRKKIILFLGRIHLKKGIDLLAKAFATLVSQRDDIYLVIAGPSEGRYADRMRALFKSMQLMNNVLFTGMLLGRDKLSAFYESHIFVLPSYGENFGIAALEAMACGVPVIVSNRVGLSNDIKASGAGITTECEPSEIAHAISKLLKNDNLRKSMGEKGRKLARENFNLQKISTDMIREYKKILYDGVKNT